MKCEVTGCENEAEGYSLDDLEVCESCYTEAVDKDYERMRDDEIS